MNNSRNNFSRWGLLPALVAGCALGAARAAPPRPRLNVIIFLADDLGWRDLGCYGSDLYRTPNIDQLARDGVRFTQAYAACNVCSPTRAALMSGEYPARLHVTDWIPGRLPANPRLLPPKWTKHLPEGTYTIANSFQDAGYATIAIGKWHLGKRPYYPEHFGFDRDIGGCFYGNPHWGYFSPYGIDTLPNGPPGEYLTDRLGDEALAFIKRHRAKPFFLYLAEYCVHTPIQARPEIVQKYIAAAKRPGQWQTNPVYAAMIESMDDTMGQLRKELRELGLSDHTIIIFGSDNGGHIPSTNNRPLKYGKGSAYEGGVRVPFIVYWPGVTKPGSVSNVPTITMDIYPTLLEAAGIPKPPHHIFDGVSLVPLLRGTGTLPPRALYWHYPHYQLYQTGGTTPYSAVRLGDYKLIKFYDGHGYNDQPYELYDIRNDIGETKDLISSRPKIAAKLKRNLDDWLKSVGAQLPTRNPKYDPSRPQKGARQPMQPYD